MFNIKVVSDLEEARKLWNIFSPNNNIYEDWDFRYTFYKYFNYPIRFYVGFEDETKIGVLPLCLNIDRGCLEFFGGVFMEDNHVLIKPGFEKYISEFYKSIKEKAELEDIIHDSDFVDMEFMEYKYLADLNNIKSVDEYMERDFSPERRKKMRKIIKKIERNQLNIHKNRFEDLNIMIELNRNSFKEESSFNKPHRKQIYKDLVSSEYEKIMLSFEINSSIEAVSFGVKYNDILVGLNAGVNKKDFSGLGFYVILKRIEEALKAGCKTFDAGVESFGWKEDWNLKKISQYKFLK